MVTERKLLEIRMHNIKSSSDKKRGSPKSSKTKSDQKWLRNIFFRLATFSKNNYRYLVKQKASHYAPFTFALLCFGHCEMCKVLNEGIMRYLPLDKLRPGGAQRAAKTFSEMRQ